MNPTLELSPPLKRKSNPSRRRLDPPDLAVIYDQIQRFSNDIEYRVDKGDRGIVKHYFDHLLTLEEQIIKTRIKAEKALKAYKIPINEAWTINS